MEGAKLLRVTLTMMHDFFTLFNCSHLGLFLVFSEIPILMENLQQNYQYWKEQDELQGREGLQPLDEEVAPDKTWSPAVVDRFSCYVCVSAALPVSSAQWRATLTRDILEITYHKTKLISSPINHERTCIDEKRTYIVWNGTVKNSYGNVTSVGAMPW